MTIADARSRLMSAQRSSNAIVLIVDDEPLIRILASDILGDIGIDVLEAADASSALAIIEAQPDIDLLFCDVNMPGPMDGIQLATEVFRRWPAMKLLITSGRSTFSNASLPDHGTFLPKPYGMDALLVAVQQKLAEA